MLNSNKEFVVLDLKQPRGKEIFLALVAKADVLIENFAAGVMDGWGWAGRCCARSIPAWSMGQLGLRLDGPYRDFAAMDVTIQAMSGITNATARPTDRRPRRARPSAISCRHSISAPASWARWCSGSALAKVKGSRWRCTRPP